MTWAELQGLQHEHNEYGANYHIVVDNLRDALDDSQIVALLNDIKMLMSRPLRFADKVTITCAAAGDYAAGDVWSASATNNTGLATQVNLCQVPGRTATVAAVFAVSSNTSLLNSLRLQMFSENPGSAEVEMDDNAVFALSTIAGRNKWAGDALLLNPFGTKGTSSTVNLNVPLSPAQNDTRFWMVVTTETAETNEASGQTVTFLFFTY